MLKRLAIFLNDWYASHNVLWHLNGSSYTTIRCLHQECSGEKKARLKTQHATPKSIRHF